MFLLESIHDSLWKSIFYSSLVSFFSFSFKCSILRVNLADPHVIAK